MGISIKVRLQLSLLLFVLVVGMSACSTIHAGPEFWVEPVIPETLTEKSEEEVCSYFHENAADFINLADYLLTHEMELKAGRPVTLDADRTILIPDENMRQTAERLLSDGFVEYIWSLNDRSHQQVVFLIDSEDRSYEQSIRFIYQPDDESVDTVDSYNDAVNRVRIFRDLDPDWYYCLFYFDGIRNADRYRQVVWELLEEQDALLRQVRQTKEEGQVTLVSRVDSRISYIDDGTAIPEGDWAMAVHYRMRGDEMIGTFVCYVDPVSCEILGFQKH